MSQSAPEVLEDALDPPAHDVRWGECDGAVPQVQATEADHMTCRDTPRRPFSARGRVPASNPAKENWNYLSPNSGGSSVMGFPSRSNVLRDLRDEKHSGDDERRNPRCVEPRITDGIETKAKREKVDPWKSMERGSLGSICIHSRGRLNLCEPICAGSEGIWLFLRSSHSNLGRLTKKESGMSEIWLPSRYKYCKNNRERKYFHPKT